MIEDGWKHPMMPLAEGSEILIQKPKNMWNETKKADSRMNIKILNSLFTAVSDKERRRIINCPTTKQAWEALATTHEGNTKVKEQRLQTLQHEFEELKMSEDEIIDEFHGRMLSITNQCQGLDGEIDPQRMVKKFLQSLLSSFESNKIAIEEARELNTYSLDELVGNLKNFESARKKPKKEKSLP